MCSSDLRAAANTKAATAWRQQRLIFENATVATVVAEFNRYNKMQITVADPKLSEERINGVFDADKPEDLIDFFSRHGIAHVTEFSEGQLSLTR